MSKRTQPKVCPTQRRGRGATCSTDCLNAPARPPRVVPCPRRSRATTERATARGTTAARWNRLSPATPKRPVSSLLAGKEAGGAACP
uniref:Uncharacterized protein n=1 Tax=Arundo donax TaxID=35708 RepID=A0A0A9AKL5_ARUDO